ncbi:hypothetical protein [Krasilnikovia sp. MM14-A1259]|uniref:hypothetical protein n=1 Tax=Krasilnikovia sp. MM14-A1259 TaxID=3373539 RepID=UPI00399D22A6
MTVAAGIAAVVGWTLAGVVAGCAAAVYAGLACRALTRSTARRRSAAGRARALDDLCALAADLRAGLPPAVAAGGVPFAGPFAADDALAATAPSDQVRRLVRVAGRDWATGRDAARAGCWPGGDPGQRRLAELTGAVWRLAERTGAPAADLVERIEADARAGDRARASAAAQAAGAQATAVLLAVLPLGGIALGYAIGADPVQVLLHTPLGGACALAAAALQCAGLLWADRLATGHRDDSAGQWA